jgi:CRP-like cAMP-binding protein
MFYLRSGRAQLSVVSKAKEATVTLLAAGDFFGEEAMTSADVSRTSTATALTACVMLRIERDECLRVMHEEHDRRTAASR